MSALSTNQNRVAPLIGEGDPRVVLTLDAGGTNFAFSALRAGELVGESCVLPACGDDLDKSLSNMAAGFERLIESLGTSPSAISFAFPGPADYPNGVVFNVGNLPAYRGGVAVAAFLEDRFRLPAYLNNDGDLFALGEAAAGLLPVVNDRLASAGASRRCRNLFAITLGTGLGGGAVIDGKLLRGDNSAAAEIWRLPSGLDSEFLAEEDASIRAVRSAYAAAAGIEAEDAPSPAQIYQIAIGGAEGEASAAKQAFEKLGNAVGAVIATATCFFDGIVVIGGGLAGARDQFMPAVKKTLGSRLRRHDGEASPRLQHEVMELDTSEGMNAFVESASIRVDVPGSSRTVECVPDLRLGIGSSRLGTNRATAIGAYAYAIQQLNSQ